MISLVYALKLPLLADHYFSVKNSSSFFFKQQLGLFSNWITYFVLH